MSHGNNILVSFSGGRTSAYMCQRMLSDPERNTKNLLFVFANTGKEREETLVFVDECDRRMGLNVVWVEAVVNSEHGEGTTHKIVNFQTASRNGEPFEAVLNKYGISNAAFPHCTRELKEKPIRSYARSVLGKDYTTALGIRIDEASRIKQKPDFIYPLLKWFVTVRDVRDFWNAQDFDLQLKDYEGNCDLCWKKSLRKKLTLVKENPGVARWWMDMEVKHSNVDRHGKAAPPFYFHRENQSTLSIVEMAKHPFIAVTDPYWKQDKSDEMDFEMSCACMNAQEND